MCQEAEGILLWALDGLRRLMSHSFQFTLSPKAQENMREAVSNGMNVVDFLESDGYIRFQTDSEASSRHLYAVYRQWCEDNTAACLSARSFGSWLKQNARAYGLEYTNKIRIGGGRCVRGFTGIRLLQPAI